MKESVGEAFLGDRREALSERTFRNYAEVVELLRHSLNGYGHSSLDRDERRRFEAAYEAGDEEAFCHLFGPEKVPEHLGEKAAATRGGAGELLVPRRLPARPSCRSRSYGSCAP